MNEVEKEEFIDSIKEILYDNLVTKDGCVVDHIPEEQFDELANDILRLHLSKVISSWISVSDKIPELIEGKDYSEVVEGYNKHNGVFFASLSWVNDGDNSGYTWSMHESGYSIDEDPSEWMDEDDYPTHWRIITKPIGE